MKLCIRSRKPRNPTVAAMFGRRAGSHRRVSGGVRQRAERETQIEAGRIRSG